MTKDEFVAQNRDVLYSTVIRAYLSRGECDAAITLAMRQASDKVDRILGRAYDAARNEKSIEPDDKKDLPKTKGPTYHDSPKAKEPKSPVIKPER